jgi:hypothetical protein
MTVWEALLLVVAVMVCNIICFAIGASVRQKVDKGEEIELPKVNPMEIVREHRERKEAAKQQEWKEAVLRNIEAYDGTGMGQKDVPRG